MEILSNGGGRNAGIYTAATGLVQGLTVTNGMAGLFGQVDAPSQILTSLTATVRLRTVSGGTVIGGPYGFTVVTLGGN
jgi:hypothetical protein